MSDAYIWILKCIHLKWASEIKARILWAKVITPCNDLKSEQSYIKQLRFIVTHMHYTKMTCKTLSALTLRSSYPDLYKQERKIDILLRNDINYVQS